MTEIISVKNLSKTYPGITAVNDLSFTVYKGDVYGFLGQNGAGKSTTIRMLLTLVKPTTGTIEIFGEDLGRHTKSILHNIGAVIEKPDLYKYLSAFENLRLFSTLSKKKLSSKELMQQLDEVGLAGRANDKVKTFSQGMKQRLGIAVALVHDPSLIILDEPVNGLDPQGIADIRRLIIYLSSEKGKTILLSSHLLHEIEQVATRVLIIDKGKKITEATAEELFDEAHTIVEIETLNNTEAVNLLRAANFAARLTNNKLTVQIDKKQIPGLNKWLADNGIAVMAVHPRHRLEDYFLQVTSNHHVDTPSV
ncbi:MAG: transporter ATP-binding protein [Chitinophagaceae bacterium]|nr:transporter ATP-binding protein [Chitinophagaceae bacterium]